MDTLRIAYAFFIEPEDGKKYIDYHPWVNFEDLRKRYLFLKGPRKFGEKA